MKRWLIDPRRFDDLRLSLGLSLPAAAGLALYGVRAVGVWGLIIAGAWLGRWLLSRLRTWTATPGRLTLAVWSLVVALFCPATLFDVDHTFFQPDARWPALVALGLWLALFGWLARRTAARRWHPVVATVAGLTLLAPSLTVTTRVLRPQSVVLGDVLDGRSADRASPSAGPWLDLPAGLDRVLELPAAAERVQDYLHGRTPPGRPTQTVARLLTDDLPPLEDLVVGGHPATLGRGSAIAVLVGGLFLVYRGLTPLRLPALAIGAAYVALVALPLPVLIGPAGVSRRWLFERDARVGLAAGLTLVHYVLVASSIPLTTVFLATLPGVRPPRKWAAAGFALVYGVGAATATVFVSVGGGPVLALLVVQGLWPRASARTNAASRDGSTRAAPSVGPAATPK